ncbi:MAG: hypothetical protein QF819_10890 [Gemmatimonadota bacterium]|nr:hypothetical protein [Gemmatimonadota bacterium]MDP6803655.1 hypothetical protein [Gemmatimonadota bacterium]MDP7031699.1 hypothetical protein [Gemmatimonadota bacterium]
MVQGPLRHGAGRPFLRGAARSPQPSGVYFLRLRGGTVHADSRVTLLR